MVAYLGSSMQQLYYTINHASISSGPFQLNWTHPAVIGEGYGNFYSYTIKLLNATKANSNVRIMNITLILAGPGGSSFNFSYLRRKRCLAKQLCIPKQHNFI